MPIRDPELDEKFNQTLKSMLNWFVKRKIFTFPLIGLLCALYVSSFFVNFKKIWEDVTYKPLNESEVAALEQEIERDLYQYKSSGPIGVERMKSYMLPGHRLFPEGYEEQFDVEERRNVVEVNDCTIRFISYPRESDPMCLVGWSVKAEEVLYLPELEDVIPPDRSVPDFLTERQKAQMVELNPDGQLYLAFSPSLGFKLLMKQLVERLKPYYEERRQQPYQPRRLTNPILSRGERPQYYILEEEEDQKIIDDYLEENDIKTYTTSYACTGSERGEKSIVYATNGRTGFFVKSDTPELVFNNLKKYLKWCRKKYENIYPINESPN